MTTFNYGYTEGHLGDDHFKWIIVEVSASTSDAGRASADTQATTKLEHGGPLVFRYVFPKLV